MIVGLIKLDTWKKQEEILDELFKYFNVNVNSRKWRLEVNKWNKAFAEGKVEYFITHSNKLGYKATTNYEEAKIARNDYIKRSVNMFNKAREIDDTFRKINNYKYDFEEEKIK